jgi:hypothetical protein
MTYLGSCHCGKITLKVAGELTGVADCNCSICSRKGALLWCVPHGDLHVFAAESDIGRYTFKNHLIEHRFCRTCGMHPFAEDVHTKTERMAYINVRCLEGLDISMVPVQAFDGRSM